MSKKSLQQKNLPRCRMNYWVLYTLAFAAMMGLAFLPFWAQGRTLISAGDSVNQFYPATIYIGQWYRQVLDNILQGNFTIPMFDPSIVLGENAVGLMTYLNLGNPLFFITALIPQRWMHLFFQWSIPMQYYLAGISFSILCFYWKRDRWSTLTATLVYLSCGYVFKTGAMYITFLSPLVYLPLLVLGFEAILQKRSVLPLVLTAWFAGLNDVYFNYMCCILLALYGVIRGAQLYGHSIRQWFLACLRGMGAFLLGLMLAAPFLLPQIQGFFGSSRSDTDSLSAALLVPSLERLKKLLFDSWMLSEGPQHNNIALCCIAILAVVLLAVRYRKRWPALCAGALVLGGLYLIPFTDYLMNALADAYDRWVFLLAFVWALVVAFVFPELMQLRRKEKILLIAVAAVGGLYALAGPERMQPGVLVSALVLSLTVAVILLVQPSERHPRRWGPMLLCGAVLLNGAAIGYWHYGDGLDGFAANGFPLQQAKASTVSAWQEFEALEPGTQLNSRVNNPTGTINASMLEGYSGINGYWSLLTGDMVQGLQGMGVMAPGWHVELSDKSALVQALLSVGYRIDPSPAQQAGLQLVEEKNGHSLYRDPGALPIAGYVYSKALPQQEFERLNAVQRQQMALKAVALEELPARLPQAQVQCTEPLPVNLVQENVLYEQGQVDLGWWSGSIRLELDAPADTRLLVNLEGLQTVQQGILIQVACGEEQHAVAPAEQPASYVVDLGVSCQPRTQITLEFSATQNFEQPTDLLLSEIQVYAIPEQQWRADQSALGQTVLEDAVLEQNRIRGRVSLQEPGVLCISYPYSRGWKATVDGAVVPVKKGNGMFLALPLESGTHQVELTYCTPGLKAGWVLFGCGVLGLAILLYKQFRSKRANGAQG